MRLPENRRERDLIYLDSNVFIYPAIYDQKSVKRASRAKAALDRVVSGELEASTATVTWDEVSRAVRRFFGSEAALLQGRSFLNLPRLKLLTVDSEVILKAQELAERDRLKPRDAIHAAAAMRNGIRELMSYDADFDAVPGLTRLEP